MTTQSFSSISSLTSSNGKVFFLTGDFAATELWVSDGSLEGTRMLKAVNSFPPSLMVDVNGTLFFVADTPAFGSGLWKSDGTLAGTVLVKDFGSSFNAALSGLTAVNGSLFMVTGNTFLGWTVWKVGNLVDVNGTLYFTINFASEPGLWKSDGTTAGTVEVKAVDASSLSNSEWYGNSATDRHGYCRYNRR